MGGRGFPYCAFLDAEGKVLWEARPTDAETFKKGLASATKLAAMNAEAKKNPSRPELAANALFFSLEGYGQRTKPGLDELDRAAATKGLDPKYLESYRAARPGMVFDDAFSKATDEKNGDGGKTLYQLWKKGEGVDKNDRRYVAQCYYGTRGAIASGAKADAKKLLGELEEAGKANPRMAKRIESDVAEMSAQIEGMKDE